MGDSRAKGSWPKYQTWELLDTLLWMRSIVEAKDPARPWWSSPREWWTRVPVALRDAKDLAELEVFGLLIQGLLSKSRIIEKGQTVELHCSPLTAWRAFHLISLFSLPRVPRWVREYLSQCASRIVQLTAEKRNNADTLAAFGLYQGRGQTLRAEFKTTERRLRAAYEVARLRYGRWVDLDDWRQAAHSAEHRPSVETGDEALTKGRLRLIAAGRVGLSESTLRQLGGDREVDRAIMGLRWSDRAAGFRRGIDRRGAPSLTYADSEFGPRLLSEVRVITERERFAELHPSH